MTLIGFVVSVFFLVWGLPDHMRFIQRKEQVERILLRCPDCRIYVADPYFCQMHEPMVLAAGKKDFDPAAWE